MSKILIVGCGYVGTTLGELLLKRHHQVVALTRTKHVFKSGILGIQGDVSDGSGFDAVPYDIDQVVYAVSANSHNDAAYEQAYVVGLRNTISFLTPVCKQLSRIVFVSSTGVYGQDDGSWVDENSPCNPSGFSGKRLLEGEELCRATGKGVICRLGGIYGPGRESFIQFVTSGEAVIYPGYPRFSNRIHRDDCAGIIAHILGMPNPESVYLGVDCDPADRSEVISWIAKRAGISQPKAVTGEPPAGRFFGTNKRCSNKKIIDSGYVFRYPSYREGYAI